jgi:hypothetical protein
MEICGVRMTYQIINIILNGFLIIITGAYVIITYRMLKVNQKTVAAMQTQTETISRPIITMTHNLSPEFMINLFIRNTGRMNADKLKLTIDQNFFQISPHFKEYNIADNQLFKEGVKSFPPGSEVMFALLPTAFLGDNEHESKYPLIFTIAATYSYGNLSYNEETTIDLRPYRYLFMPSETVQQKLEKLIKEIKEIKEVIKNQPAA